ncbi:hypothetical protein H2200_002692 [Cladophialophora chaetospira]|uniref:Uncharacterized protein n=1 Tax=Cladophialophora chaetospira TaxID=386627 RepID=A0AA39CNT4_9EURO|nr:hypothetical protein H2200_002692 [Cladophialophora chaetospira]
MSGIRGRETDPEMEHDAADFVPFVTYQHHSDKATSVATELPDRNQKHEGSLPALGKPSRRTRSDLSDLLSVMVSLLCFGIGVAAIADSRFATRLGQTNQLVVIGFILSIMSFISFKQAQTFMLVLEARFGQSTLQNYDAILRDEKLGSQTSNIVRFALLFLFGLPLGLSASYKQFVGGSTTISVEAPHQVIHFGPSGPPGLLVPSGRPLFLNATSPLFAGHKDILRQSDIDRQERFFNQSYGFNMYVINDTATAMLDLPVSSNMSRLQSSLQHGEVLTISAPVNATFAMLNSTPESSELEDPDYWIRIQERFGSFDSRSYVINGLGGGPYFNMYNSMVDTTLILMSLFNATNNETFTSKALGFHTYRGTADGTWRIASDSINLVSASNFETNFLPDRRYPEVVGTSDGGCIRENATTDWRQKAIYCNWESFGVDYNSIIPGFVIGRPDETNTFRPSPPSIWVAVTASMAWSNLAAQVESYGIPNAWWQYLLSTPEYEIWKTIPTLRRHWGLYTVLAVQPMLLLIVLLGRLLLHPAPISANFGMIALLAGVDKRSLNILDGASFSGKLHKPVIVHITERQYFDDAPPGTGLPVVDYRLSMKEDGVKSSTTEHHLQSTYQQVGGIPR